MSASENGWQPAWVDQNSLQWTVVPGTNVNLQIMKGQPLAVMRAFAADFNAFVEPLRDRDSASYTPTNSVSTSNHLNGTAMDLNWDSHPFHVRGTFNAAQMKTIRALLDFYEDTIFWAGDWNDPIDEMHWQMGYGSWNNPKTASFITRKIRSDGYSTFRRGPTQAKPIDVPATTTPAAGGSMAQVPQDQWDRVYRELTQRYPSRSPLRHVGEGLVDTEAGLILNTDANLHVMLVKSLAEIGDESALDLLAEVARADLARYPERAADAQLAQRILAHIEAVNPAVLSNYLKAKAS